MATLDSPTKVCSRCGLDCSHKQRAKDTQGRYICQDCLDKARAAAKSPTPAPKPAAPPPARSTPPAAQAAPDDGGVLGKLIDESVAQAKHGCPNCHARMKQDQILCVKCGFNLERGKQMQTVVKKAVVDKGAEPALKRRGSFLNKVGPGIGALIALVSMALLGVLYFMATNGGEQEKVIFLVAQGVFSILTLVFCVVIAFTDSPGQGMAILGAGLFSLVGPFVAGGVIRLGSVGLWLYVAYWVFVESESRLLQMLMLVSIISRVAAVMMILQMANDAA